MMKIAVVLGSTRPGRNTAAVADWVMQAAAERSDAEYELVDIAEFNLPPLDEAYPPQAGNPQQPHTHAWAAKIAEFDGFIFVTPEYNHSVPGSFKNAVDYLFYEWNNKAIGFVSFGSVGGVRAVEAWRLIAAELKLADVRPQVSLSLITDFENFSVFKPADYHAESLEAVFTDVVAWSQAMATLRD
ncbi:MAG: NAD(P)H-dependent oxidoreductase [Actinomycetia bacterium]|nr:NAD(P)H-dependent oxidoreductase [Actinomycetes bacterium]